MQVLVRFKKMNVSQEGTHLGVCTHGRYTFILYMYVVNMEMKINNKYQYNTHKFILIKILNVHKCSVPVPPVVGCLFIIVQHHLFRLQFVQRLRQRAERFFRTKRCAYSMRKNQSDDHGPNVRKTTHA